jgi:hypothetical protein
MKMKHLLNGVAVIAALTFSAPVWAQPANPSGGNAVGTPGPNPGGPGLTPYTTGAPPPAPAPSGRMPSGGRRTSGERIPAIMPETSPPSASETTSATPPKHHHAGTGKMASHHPSRFPNAQGNVANQLNQAELARLQQGAPPTSPQMAPPPPPPRGGGNSMGMPGPNTGGPGLTPYSAGTPQR